MVYFNCIKCGTGLKKSQVETHMFQCKSRLVNCIDCQKDFRDNEFKAHIKCLTESERYESKNYVAKANKGELKQSTWIEKIEQAVAVFKGSPKARALLEKMVEYPNVPRKKAKFVNFVRNSLRYMAANDVQIEELWTVIESFDKKAPEQLPMAGKNIDNGHHTNGTKRKFEETHQEVQTEENVLDSTGAFDWLEEIKRVCCKRGQVPLDKLERKLYKRFRKHNRTTEDEADEEDDELKFKKKLSKKLKKLGPFISLVESSDGGEHPNGAEGQSIMLVRYSNDE